MVNYINEFEKKQVEKINNTRGDIVEFTSSFEVGDTIKVRYKITEGSVTRLQAFIGVVIARTKKFSNYSSTFTVRKIGSNNIGVERKFTFYSPLISDIEVIKRGLVRRAKLYYLRNLTGKAARIKEKLTFIKK